MNTTSTKANTYLNLSKLVQEKWAKELIEYVGLKQGDTCLDIGCGTGNGNVLMSEIVGLTGKVIALDPDTARIGEAKRHNNRKNIFYINGKIADVSLEKESVDGATAATVLHWMPTLEKVMLFEHLYDLLKPGACFSFNQMTSYSLNVRKLLKYYDFKKREKYENSLFLEDGKFYSQIAKKHGFLITFEEYETKNIVFSNDTDFIRVLDVSNYTEFEEIFETYKTRMNIEGNEDGHLIDTISYGNWVFQKL